MAGLDRGRAPVTRRSFFGSAGGVAAGTALAGGLAGGLAVGAAGRAIADQAPPDAETPPHARPGPREALRILLAGNRRWVRGCAQHPRQSPWWRHHLAHQQHPFAVVVSCIDSRVPPELVFDCGLGEILTVRTGAQTLDQRVVLGSIEYGPVTFGSARLIVVLGHGGCGAVSDAIKVISSGGRAPGHIQAVVDALRPAYHVAIREPGNLLENMIRAQTRLTVRRLHRDRLLRDFVARKGLMIVGAHYHMQTGAVTMV